MVGIGRSAKNSYSKGTTMKKSNQIQSVDVSASAVPERVSVAMSEIAENMSEGLLALAVGAGLQVMAALMEADVTALAGPKGRHDQARTAVRHGRERGSVTLGGRRVPVTRPRVRAADGTGELAVASYELFSSTEILGRLAMEKMLAGLSTRRYPVGLEPVGVQITEKATATSKSAVSRRFVAMTETALAELLSRDLSGLDLVALMIDGVHFAESCCVVALGIDIEGTKHPLALVEGSTENATLVTELLVDLRERGLDVTRAMLVGLDGSKALRKAVLDVLDHPVIQRCQLHKVRNVKDHLPQRLRTTVGRRMTDAYHAGSALEAEAALLALAKELDRTHPSAAASLREGLDETLTVLRLGVPPTLARTLRSTNCIESMISVCREHAGNVKRWRDGQMALRWCAAGMVEAGKQFRRVNGHLHLPALRAALEREVAEHVVPVVHNDQVSAA
uniref:Mutator family transposase n=3 Tax=Mycolicibacterium TaxID=1866885 RepID=A4TFH0_MYCGI|nr:transposase, mutator type [Mycolicibacterium gilvum PYR-GCK]